jgi:aspartyl-tRNA(Asn)/glutamyl-tRNA(Gln) amidotransferase subunit A
VEASIQKISAQIRGRKISPVEVTKYCLARIEKLNPVFNAFITVTADSALAAANAAESEIQQGNWRGPLHGVPVALKDLIDTAGVLTTAGSALFQHRIPTIDAEVVRRLKQAGAILLGKQNLHEFAYGGSSMISFFGEVRNPWNRAHIAGGSSGGSASAVAAGMCFAAIGTDTAGSVREPAAQCGIVGLKPTYGRVSAQGVIPLSPSLDHVGPITRTVADAAIVLQAITEPRSGCETISDQRSPDFSELLTTRIASVRIGIPRRFFFDDLNPEVAAATEEAISVLQRLGGVVHELELPVPTDRTLQSAESYAAHAENIARSPELYQPETLRRIRSGENIPPDKILKCRQELAEIRGLIQSVFHHVDVLITPTTPIPAPEIAELRQDLDQLRPREVLLLRNTRPANVWGLPAISVPCGFTRAGLPIGLQIIGPAWNERSVLQVAHAFEHATAWHERQPEPHL